MGPRDLSYFLSLPYEIRIWENDGALTANIRELSLIATAPDAGAAVDALAIRKREYFESIDEFQPRARVARLTTIASRL